MQRRALAGERTISVNVREDDPQIHVDFVARVSKRLKKCGSGCGLPAVPCGILPEYLELLVAEGFAIKIH